MQSTSYLARIAIIGLVAALALSCDIPLSGEPSPPGAAETGTLVLAFADGVSARTLLPNIDMEPASYRVVGSGPNGESFEVTTDEEQTTIESLAFGDWTVTVTAFNADGDTIGSGQTEVTVVTGETAFASIPVTPIEGVGTLTLVVDWNDGDIDIPSIVAGLVPTEGPPMDLEFTIEGSSAHYTGATVPTGYHTLSLQLLDNGIVTAGAVEVVRIVDGATTDGEYTFDRINRPGGSIDVRIVQQMGDPLTVAIEGGLDTIEQGQVMTLSGNVVEDVNVTYAWYVNGQSVATGETFEFVADEHGLGHYRIDLTAISGGGSRAGSTYVTSEVVAEVPAAGPLATYSFENSLADSGASSLHLEDRIFGFFAWQRAIPRFADGVSGMGLSGSDTANTGSNGRAISLATTMPEGLSTRTASMSFWIKMDPTVRTVYDGSESIYAMVRMFTDNFMVQLKAEDRLNKTDSDVQFVVHGWYGRASDPDGLDYYSALAPATFDLHTGEFHHVVAVFDGRQATAQLRIYLDAALVYELEVDDFGGFLPERGLDAGLNILEPQITIDELAFFEEAVSEAEVVRLYQEYR